MIQLTIELPDQLAEQLTTYEDLRVRLVPKDGSKLLALAGIVTAVPRGAAEHAEDFEN